MMRAFDSMLAGGALTLGLVCGVTGNWVLAAINVASGILLLSVVSSRRERGR